MECDDYLIPKDAIHNENTLESFDSENAEYETNKYIIKSCIYTPTKFRQLDGHCLDVCII